MYRMIEVRKTTSQGVVHILYNALEWGGVVSNLLYACVI